MKRHFRYNKEADVHIISERYTYQGFFRVKEYFLRHRLFAGQWSNVIKRELFERPPVAAALPYDPIQNKVILIEQFRLGALSHEHPWLLEIVAGIADEKDQDPDDLIRREIQEESGLVAKNIHKMYEYWVSPGGSNEFLTLYCAHVDAPEEEGVHGLADEDEDIFVHVLETQTALDMLSAGKIKNAITIMALQWLALNKIEIDRLWK